MVEVFKNKIDCIYGKDHIILVKQFKHLYVHYNKDNLL